MRRGPWLTCLALCLIVPLAGCAKLNEWLEGSVSEEEEDKGPSPEEELANQTKALAGTSPGDRKAAIGKLVGLKREDALAEVLKHIDDADDNVAREVLSNLQTLTGFPEKTEDERQLDPEGYDQQLLFKQRILEQGLPKLAALLGQRGPELRYGSLVVLYNFTRAPVVPETAIQTLRDQVAEPVAAVALDAGAAEDARLLAIECLVAAAAGPQVARLAELLNSPSEPIRARAALAMAQAAPLLGDGREAVVAKLSDLARDPAQSEAVRWRVYLALGRLGAKEVPQGTQKFALELTEDEAAALSDPEKVSGLEAYRGYALSSSPAPDSTKEAHTLSAEVSGIATKAEEELDAERKKGYR